MAYEFEGSPVNVTNLGSGNEAKEPTAIQYHTNRISCIYRKANLLYIQYSDDRGSTWESASQIIADTNAKEPCICRNYFDGWALVWAAYTDEGTYEIENWEIKFCQALSKTSLISDILEASIDKGIGMTANSLRAVISNEDNKYDFQKADSIWEGQLVFGNEVEFYAGLGDNLNKRFKGEIDVVNYKDVEGIIEISARSRASKLLDGKFGEKKTYSTSLTYKQAIEAVLQLAGFESDEYHIEDTAIVLSEEKIFDREQTLLTAIQELMDDMGWIIWEDEDGKIWIGTPTNYPTIIWNYIMNVNCFSVGRNLDRISIPSKVIVSNEDLNIEKEADLDPQDFGVLNSDSIEYISTREDDESNIQTIANARRDDLELKVFTIEILVPYNFYLQLRDKIQIQNTKIPKTNVGILIRVTETVGRKGLRSVSGMYSQLRIAVIS